MEGQPKCKKCGRVLTSAESITRGMGSRCAGIPISSGKGFHSKPEQAAAKPYDSIGASSAHNQVLLGDLPKKPIAKRELHRRRLQERRLLFETHQTFQCGLVLPERKPLIYEPVSSDSWKDSVSGRIITHEQLQQYLVRYRFI